MYQTATQIAEKMPDTRLLMSNEPEMESSLHYYQLLLLVTCLEWYWRDRKDYFIGANLTVYFSSKQLKNQEFRGPDFFLVNGVSNHPRPSWVVWEEDGKYPNLIIELLSDSTATVDRGIKKQLYQDRFRTPEYFWFSPDSLEFMGYRLNGHQYQEIPLTNNWRWSEELELYLGVEQGKLRYFTPDGQLVPTLQEVALQEKAIALQEKANAEREKVIALQEKANALQEKAIAEREKANAEQEKAIAEREKLRVDHLVNYLRSLGINPDDII